MGLTILRISATQHPFAFQFLAGKKNGERAFPEITLQRFVRSEIPNHDSAAAVFSLGNDALELQIVDRVILCLKASARFAILEREFPFAPPMTSKRRAVPVESRIGADG